MSIVVTCAVVALIGAEGYGDYQNLRRELRLSAQHAAENVSGNTSRILGETAIVLEDVRQIVQEGDRRLIRVPASKVHGRLLQKLSLLSHVDALLVLGAKGKVLHSASLSPGFAFDPDVAVRLVNARHGRGAVLIFQTFKSAENGAPKLLMGRTIDGPQKKFVVAVVDPDHLRTAIDVGAPTGTHMFLRRRNEILAHATAGTEAPKLETWHTIVPRNLPNASSGLSQVKGEAGRRWLVSFQRLPNRQFTAIALVPQSGIWTAWLARRVPSLVLAGIAIILLWTYTTVATRQMARRRLAERTTLSAQAQLNDAIESIPLGFALFDPDDRLVLFNNEFARLYEPIAESLRQGESYADVIRAQSRLVETDRSASSPEDWIADRRAYHASPNGPLEQKFKSGDWRLISERRTSDGGSVCVETDISRQKQTEKKLQDAKDEAELANRTKSEFLANMSHELRTPLNAIIGMSDMMKSEVLGPIGEMQYSEYANDINDSGLHLLGIINDILDISAIENGSLLSHEEDVDCADVVTTCSRLVDNDASKKSISLRIEVDNLKPHLRADPKMLKQIVLNLLSNAVKFTPEGGDISVRLKACARDGLAIEVEDNGIGIKSEDLERVKEPFVQCEEGWSRNNPGTGLGLSLVDSMVDLHGGRFTLESEFGVGTTAIAWFPPERVISVSPWDENPAVESQGGS